MDPSQCHNAYLRHLAWHPRQDLLAACARSVVNPQLSSRRSGPGICLSQTLPKNPPDKRRKPIHRAIQAYLGHRSIMSTVRYTALTPNRFKNFWKD
jgi:hypothetical protein